MTKKEYNKAIEQYNKIILDRNYVYVWYNKGLVLSYSNRHDEAIKCYTEAYLLRDKLTNPTLLDKIIKQFAEELDVKGEKVDELLIRSANKLYKDLVKYITEKLKKS